MVSLAMGVRLFPRFRAINADDVEKGFATSHQRRSSSPLWLALVGPAVWVGRNAFRLRCYRTPSLAARGSIVRGFACREVLDGPELPAATARLKRIYAAST